MDEEKIVRLIQEAAKVREIAYAPYSEFLVGAALLTEEGEIYTGCNIENAAYGPSNCAERTAVFKAVSEGKRKFTAIAVIGGTLGKKVESYTFPCGVCRQVMAEFCIPESFVIIVAKNTNEYQLRLLKELLPESFGLPDLKKMPAQAGGMEQINEDPFL